MDTAWVCFASCTQPSFALDRPLDLVFVGSSSYLLSCYSVSVLLNILSVVSLTNCWYFFRCICFSLSIQFYVSINVHLFCIVKPQQTASSLFWLRIWYVLLLCLGMCYGSSSFPVICGWILKEVDNTYTKCTKPKILMKSKQLKIFFIPRM